MFCRVIDNPVFYFDLVVQQTESKWKIKCILLRDKNQIHVQMRIIFVAGVSF